MLKTGCVRYGLRRAASGAPGQVGVARQRVDGRRPRAEHGPQLRDVGGGRRLVQRDSHRRGGQAAQVDLSRGGRLQPGARPRPRRRRRERCRRTARWRTFRPAFSRPRASTRGEPRRALGDRAQAAGAVIDGVHPGHDGQQNLRGADVAGRLLAADVLLARLQRHAQRAVAVRVLGDADEAPGQLAGPLGARREKGRVRAAVPQRHAEALRAAQRHVGADLAGRRQHRQRQKVRRHRDQRAGVMRAAAHGRQVRQRPVGGRVLQQHAERLLAREVEALGVADPHVDAQRLGARAHDFDRLRVTGGRDQKHAAPVLLGGDGRQRVKHVHRFGGGGRLVQQRRIRDRQAGQIGHHRLEVQQRFQAALRDLRLIRRVLRVPAGVLQDVALDDGGREAVRVAHAQEGFPHLVLGGEAAQLGQHLGLTGGRRQVQRAGEPDVLGDSLGDQRVQRRRAEGLQHLGFFSGVRTDVAVSETLGRTQLHGHAFIPPVRARSFGRQRRPSTRPALSGW